MYNVKWDPDTNGVLLTSDEGDVNSPVRPVFFEELNLIGLNNIGIRYPESESPLLFAAGRNYYYRGKKIFSVQGGGFFENIKIIVHEKIMEFEPVDIEKVILKNCEKLRILVHDSIDFIRSTHLQYKDSVDISVVSFSGGKDSVVLLDLVKRSLGTQNFIVLFADTTLESPFTYDFINLYRHKNPTIPIHTVSKEINQIDLWNCFGSPSRIHRWCHIVYKTAPIQKYVKKQLSKDNPWILLFDGIRSEESARRSNYSDINLGTKDMKQINVSPLLSWSSLEIFLYIFHQNIPFNKCYRYGYTRVGCVICPYTSNWSDFLSSRLHQNEIKPYLNFLTRNAKFANVHNIQDYLNKGNWKSRSGGIDLDFGGNRIDYDTKNSDLIIYLENSQKKFLFWVNCIGKVISRGNTSQLIYNNNIYQIDFEKLKNSLKVTVIGGNLNLKLKYLLIKAAYKSEYCINCGACQAICPIGAFTDNKFDNSIEITSKCSRCALCINYHEKGCLIAKSITYLGTKTVKTMQGKGMNRYQTFGLRENWMNEFLHKSKWSDDSKSNLGKYQIMSLKSWLKDADLYDGGEESDLGKIFIEIKDRDDLFMWAVIWINLAYNSPLINWFVMNIGQEPYSRLELIKKATEYRGKGETTKTESNAIASLMETLTKSPIGQKLNQALALSDTDEKTYQRAPWEDIPTHAMLYSLYRYAEAKGRYDLVVSELINNHEISPYWLFLLNFGGLRDSLIKIASNHSKYISVEFSGNLENIRLKPNYQSIEIVKANYSC